MARGFAAMTPERRKEIASKGGKAAQAVGTAHKFTYEEARAAGSKGGNAIAARGSTYMADLGRKGGKASKDAAAQRRQQQGTM